MATFIDELLEQQQTQEPEPVPTPSATQAPSAPEGGTFIDQLMSGEPFPTDPAAFDPSTFPTAREQVLAQRGTALGEVGNFISRPNFAAASAVAEWDRALEKPDTSLWEAFNQAAGGFWRGITGKQHDTFYSLALDKFQSIKNDPNIPDWLKTAYGHALGTFGFVSDLVLDPLNLVSPVAIASKVGRVANVTPDIRSAARKLRNTPAGQYLLEKFSSFGTMQETEFVHRMRQMRHEMQALEAQAVRQNIPREQMVRDLEKAGIPREVTMDLIERPRVIEQLDEPTLVSELQGGVEPIETMQLIDPDLVPEEFRQIQIGDESIHVDSLDDAEKARQALINAELDNMLTEIQMSSVEPGGLMRARGPGASDEVVTGRFGTISTTPDWFKNQGWTRERVERALEVRNEKSPVFQQLREIAVDRLSGNLERGMFRDDGLDVEWAKLSTMLQPEFTQEVATAVSRERFMGNWSQARPVAAHFHKWNAEQINFEKNVLGVNIDALFEDDPLREYMGHYRTPEAKAAGISEKMLQDALDRPIRESFKGEARRTIQHASTKERKIKHLTATEINNLPKEEKEKLFGIELEEDIPIYITDPVKSQVIRDMLSARATAMVRFLRDVTDNPRWARRLQEGETAPPGWRELKGLARDGFAEQVKGVVFNPEIATAFEEVVDKSYDADRIDLGLQAFDRFMRFWKSITLGTSPKWVVNNVVGNVWNGWILAGASPSSIIDAGRVMLGRDTIVVQEGDTLSEIAERFGTDVDTLVRINNLRDPNLIVAGQELAVPGDAVITVNGRRISREEILGEAQRRGIIGTGLFSGVAGSGTNTFEDVMKARIAERNPVFRVNKGIEEHARLALFIDGLKRGMTEEEATKRVFKYLFDYSDLSNFEREWLNNRFWPFYTFWRKNTALQMQALAENPGKFTIIPKTTRAIEQDQELQEKRTLPEHLQSSVQIGREGDITQFVNLAGLPPIDVLEFAQNPQQILASNPLVNAAATGLFGFNLFTGEQIPENFRTEILGTSVPTRLFETASALVPPIRTIQAITNPRSNPFSPQPDLTFEQALLQRIFPVFQRSEAGDLADMFEQIRQRIEDERSSLRFNLGAGNESSAEAALNEILRIITEELGR